MAHQPVPEPHLLFPHEQYKRRHAYEAASTIARKNRRSKLNDHRRLSLQHNTTQRMTADTDERSDAAMTARNHHYRDYFSADDEIEESSLPGIVAVVGRRVQTASGTNPKVSVWPCHHVFCVWLMYVSLCCTKEMLDPTRSDWHSHGRRIGAARPSLSHSDGMHLRDDHPYHFGDETR
jgi:hypothetical protein